MKSISVIVYTSNTGYTQRYAAMLGRAAGLPVHRLGDAALPRGTAVVYLGWLCAGGIKGLKKARSHYNVQAVCAVGMAPASPEYASKLSGQNRLKGAPLFYLQGGYSPARLTGIYRPMMALMGKVVSRAPADSERERAMQEAFSKGGDWVSEAQLAPVLEWLQV